MSGDHYQTLGVTKSVSPEDLRTAYRNAARANHPDAQGASDNAHVSMAALNAAWEVLSDPERRQAYDASQRPPVMRTPPPRADAPVRPEPGARREAWLEGMRTQMLRLGNQAGRSATMNLSLPTGRDRPRYAAMLEPIIEHLAQDTAPRIRQARSLGAAPLDLGVVAALVGLRSYADVIAREIRAEAARTDAEIAGADRGPVSNIDDIAMRCALVDRMWDVMAHEVPHDIAMDLGGNPHLARSLYPPSKRSRRRGRKR